MSDMEMETKPRPTSEPTPAEPSSPAREAFMEVVAGVLAVDRSPEADRVMDLMLIGLVKRGFILLPLPADLTAKLAGDQVERRSPED